MIRLILVELRRAVDTRGPLWAFAAAAVSGVLLSFVVARDATTFAEFVAGLSLALPLLMGLLAVMAFTAEWSTRAALTTFAVTPRRQRILGARYAAILLLAAATLVAIHLLAAIGFAVTRPGSVGSVFDVAVLAQFWQMLATTVAATLTAIAVASLVLRTALALLIAVFGPFLLTIGLAFTPGLVDWMNPYGFASWLAEPQLSWTVTSETTVGLGPAVTSFAVWTALPLALGWVRQLRAEPR